MFHIQFGELTDTGPLPHTVHLPLEIDEHQFLWVADHACRIDYVYFWAQDQLAVMNDNCPSINVSLGDKIVLTITPSVWARLWSQVNFIQDCL